MRLLRHNEAPAPRLDILSSDVVAWDRSAMFSGRIGTLLAVVAAASMLQVHPASAQQGLSAPGSAGGQSAAAEAPSMNPFWTKYAYFVPSRFNHLPGWRDDTMTEAWKAFRASCTVLASRAAWTEPCASASA